MGRPVIHRREHGRIMAEPGRVESCRSNAQDPWFDSGSIYPHSRDTKPRSVESAWPDRRFGSIALSAPVPGCGPARRASPGTAEGRAGWSCGPAPG